MNNCVSTLGLLLCLTIIACQAEQSTTSDTTEKSTAVAGNNTAPAEVPIPPATPPRSAGCNYLPDSIVLAALELPTDQVLAPLPGPSVSSCYYRLDGERWTADLLLQVAYENEAANLLESIETAPSAEAGKVNGHQARWQNENRVLQVAASPPYTIKLSVLPKLGDWEPKSSADRQVILTQLAKELEARL
ncbi:MAG: hypothetical protein AAFQ37_06020 [Bacteroidota bacterium]